MADPLILKKHAEAKKLHEKMLLIPEGKYKKRAVIKAKIRELITEIKDLQRFNNDDGIMRSLISELQEWYRKRSVTSMPPRDFRGYTIEQLQHHLKKIRERKGVDNEKVRTTYFK